MGILWKEVKFELEIWLLLDLRERAKGSSSLLAKHFFFLYYYFFFYIIIIFFLFQATLLQLGIFVVVKYMHHRDDLVEHRTREASFGAQYTNHSANSICYLQHISVLQTLTK